MGFTFDDTDKKGVANPTSLMHELIAKDPRNADRIFPYIGGEEVNDSPTHAHHRYVINFENFPRARDPDLPRWDESDEKQRREFLRHGIVPSDYTDPVAADWPDLLKVVEENVKPERDKDNREIRKRYWWRFAERAPALYMAISPLSRVLATSQTSTLRAFAFLPQRTVFSHKLVVFAIESIEEFAIIHSRIHELWSNFLGSSMKDDPVYTVETCFDPFPFPNDCDRTSLSQNAEQYYSFRRELMKGYGEGLTTVYNRFHDPDERSNAIGELRRLHDAMDRAVLDAYGWTEHSADL